MRHLKRSIKLGCGRVGTERLVWVGEGDDERPADRKQRACPWLKGLVGWIVASTLAGYLVGLAGVWWWGN